MSLCLSIYPLNSIYYIVGYFINLNYTLNWYINDWKIFIFRELHGKQITALASLLQKYLVVHAVGVCLSRTRFETRCAPAMGSNCCKGDAAGKPLVRSSSSIYNRYLWLAIISGQELYVVPWVLRLCGRT